MAILQTTDRNFNQTIGQPGIVLVDFWAPWCGPCRILGPVLDQLNEIMGDDVTIAKVNVDNNPMTASRYRIMSIPTIKIFRNGIELNTLVGVQSLESLKKVISQYQ